MYVLCRWAVAQRNDSYSVHVCATEFNTTSASKLVKMGEVKNIKCLLAMKTQDSIKYYMYMYMHNS